MKTFTMNYANDEQPKQTMVTWIARHIHTFSWCLKSSEFKHVFLCYEEIVRQAENDCEGGIYRD